MNLSKETSNSLAEMMDMPFHIVFGMYNTLQKIFKKEKEESERQQKEEESKYNIPNINDIQNSATRGVKLPSTPSMPNINIPSSGSIHL